MKKSVRLTSLILAVIIMVSLFAGCSSNSKTESSANSEKPSQSNKPADSTKPQDSTKSGETLSFSVTLPSFGAKIEDSMVHKEWVKQMESIMGKKLDIKYNYIPISEYKEKSNLLLASGDTTDLFMIMSQDLYKKYETQGLFLDLSPYKDLLPNYMSLVDKAPDGQIKAIRSDGKIYGLWNMNLPRQAKDKGMGVYTPATYRYDILQKNSIEIPKTFDELYGAAKKLKEVYPNSFPVNSSGSFDALFNANHNGGAKIYWNGQKYGFGPTEESYKEALEFANRLYSEKLLDPEVFSDKSDAIKKKMLSGTNYILLQNWFNAAAEWNRSATGGEKFAISLFPNNPKYGKAWQSIYDFSTVDIDLNAIMVINSKSKNGKELAKFLDLQYKPDIIKLITWGIEGTTYTMGADGLPNFVDSIKNAANTWAEGDKYGMRSSASYRPGLQATIDTRAFVNFAPKDASIVDGKLIETPWETAFKDLPFPNDFTPPWIKEPYLEFTDAEKELISSNLSPINTYVAEMQNKFINGKEKFENWTAFQEKIKKTGDLDKVLQIYNDALKRYQDRAAKK